MRAEIIFVHMDQCAFSILILFLVKVKLKFIYFLRNNSTNAWPPLMALSGTITRKKRPMRCCSLITHTLKAKPFLSSLVKRFPDTSFMGVVQWYTFYPDFTPITKDSFLRALREVAPEMELFPENHGKI